MSLRNLPSGLRRALLVAVPVVAFGAGPALAAGNSLSGHAASQPRSPGLPLPTLTPPSTHRHPRTTTTTAVPATTTTTTSPAPTTTQPPTSTLPPTTTTTVAASGGLVAGIDTPPANDDTAISEIGRTPALMNAFYGFYNESSGNIEPFPKSYVDSVIARGSTPMITWQPNLPNWTSTSVLTSLADGSEDSYITAWAQAAKAENHKIYVRLMHEFNGDWYPWGAVRAGSTPYSSNHLASNPPPGYYPYTNTPQMFVAAYQHVVQLFDQAGATNVEFVWCIGANPLPSDLSAYYPGDAYVQWASMDGYNRSSSDPKSFYDIFEAPYKAIQAMTSRPILVAETASVEYSGGPSSGPVAKAQWIEDTYLKWIPGYFPQIRAIDYFDFTGAGYSYPIDTSQSAEQAIRQVFANSEYQAAAP